MPRLLLAPALLLGVVLPPPRCGAQPFVERLDPPVLVRGKTTRLTAVGSRLGANRGLWTSLPAGAVKAAPVAGAGGAALDVQVAADAPVGVFGLRLATADGLSNVHLFLVDDLPARPAPDSTNGAARVDLPCALWGRFREAEVDRFAIEVKAGQRVSFEVVGNRLGKEVDPLVTIRDARGRFVAERDNDPGLYFDCRFEHRFSAAGTYVVEVRDARFQGHGHGSYVLRMGRFPAARVAVPAAVRRGKRNRLALPELNDSLAVDLPATAASGPLSVTVRRPSDEGSAWLPVEVGDVEPTVAAADALTPKKGTPAAAPGRLCGVLRNAGERQFFRLTLKAGGAIHLEGHGRWHNSSIDLDLAVTDEAGRALAQAAQGEDDVARLDFTAPRAGVYCVAVRDLGRDGGPACAYRIDVRGGPAAPTLVAEVEGLTVPRGSYQPVPLTVTRNGYTGPISLTLSGAPSGVRLSPAEVPAGADSLVCKLSAADAAPLGHHTVQILARPSVGAFPAAVVRTRPLVDRQLLNEDLIPYSLREDQRRLPPSVSDRLALQVTEAAPFTVELADALVTLPRYQNAPVTVVTTRKPGFDGPLSFTARGGQLADKEEGRTRVFAEFPQATAKALRVTGRVHSRILANLGRTRVEVSATATHGDRRVTLCRTFDLEIRTAFSLARGPAPVKVRPGMTATVRVEVVRLASFTGPVTVRTSPADGLAFPETVVVPSGRSAVEVAVKVEPGAAAGLRGVALSATADVDGFEEEVNGGRIDVEVLAAERKK